MSALAEVDGVATPRELMFAYPDRFNETYLHKACNRLYDRGSLTRRPGARGKLGSFRGSRWSYSVKRD